MNSSLLCLSPFIASTNAFARSSIYGTSLKSRFCVSTRHSALGRGSVQHSRSLVQTPFTSQKQSIRQFVSSSLLQATHRSRIYDSGSSGSGGGGGGPWQRFRDSVNAVPGDFIFWGIIGLNGVVFVSWNFAWAKWQSTGDPSSYAWMRDHFVSSLDNVTSGRWYTMVTSCFSHENTAHLLFNGFTFYFMAPAVLSLLGNVGFLTLYLGGGIVSSLTGIAWRNSSAQTQAKPGAHGASGAIYSVISFFACIAPTATFYLFGVVPLPAWAVVTGVFLYDGYSAMNEHRVGTDTAGHIGGLLAGIGYFIAKRFRLF